MTVYYKPFCSLACNREYHAMTVAGDTLYITEPHCLNCGAPTVPLGRLMPR